MTTAHRPIRSSKLEVKSLEDVESFFHFATTRDRTNIWSIDLILNANDFCDYKDDLLAMAFKQLQPERNTNPHDIHKIVVKVEGMTLFTRQTYTAVSPVASWDVDKKIQGLLTGRTTIKDKEKLPFGIISQEKAFVPALLGIRGVHEVGVMGKMEANLKREIITNLKTQVGASVPTPPPRGHLGINSIFWSTSYDRKRVRDMSYNPYAPKDGDDEVRSPTTRTRLRRLSTVNAIGNPYTIETLKRINARPQDGDDYGPGKHAITKKHYDYMDPIDDPEGRTGKDWTIPSGKGARCTMGWNAIAD